MAKTQDLPLNPAKISGLCNRLLCCLTYEYDSYRAIKKEMPRVGKSISLDGQVYKVIRIMAIQGTVHAINQAGEEVVLSEEQWRAAEPVHLKAPVKGPTPEK
jgi:cell fate regulator YaaT (PSP1 superfamily)